MVTQTGIKYLYLKNYDICRRIPTANQTFRPQRDPGKCSWAIASMSVNRK